MPQTIRITPASEQPPSRERTMAEAIRLVAETAAGVEPAAGNWAERFESVMDNGVSLPGIRAVCAGSDPVDALADSFALRLGATAAGRDAWGNPGLTNVAHKLARLLIADKRVGLDLSNAQPEHTDDSSSDDDIRLSRVVPRLRQIVEGLGVSFTPAMLAIRCDHPAVQDFFDIYLDESPEAPALAVKISADFMEAVRADKQVRLRHPRPGTQVDQTEPSCPDDQEEVGAAISARALWHRLVSLACRTPRVHLILENCMRPASPLGHFEVTDAVSPYLLQTVPAESAQIIVELDLSRFIDPRLGLLCDSLDRIVGDGLRLADNLIDAVRWPLDGIRSDACAYRRIALTIQGIGEAAVKMGLDPADFSALQRLQVVLQRIARRAYCESLALAREREPFPGLRAQDLYTLLPQHGLEDEVRAKIRAHGTRNSHILVLGPFSVIPARCPPAGRADFSNFLPLLRFAHTLAFRRPPFLDFMHGEDLARFLRLSWAYFARGNGPHK